MNGRQRIMVSVMCGPGMRQMEHVIHLAQEFLAHVDASTTMIYTHVIKKGVLAVQSPFDAL